MKVRERSMWGSRMGAPALAVALTLVIAACGGDKPLSPADDPGESPRSSSDARPASSQLVSAEAALGEAAANAQDVESFRGTMKMETSFGGLDLDVDGTMLFEAPDKMHMVMETFGIDTEVLAYGADMYLRVGGSEWMKFDLGVLGIDTGQFQELVENQGFFDLEELARTLGDVEQLDDDVIGGETYRHYRVEADFDEVLGSLPDGFLDASIAAQAADMFTSVTYEFWVDPEHELPRRFEMVMGIDAPGGASGAGGRGGMFMSFDYVEYNVPVEIPAEPVDAPLFDPESLGR